MILQRDKFFIIVATFAVAFCSIVYELVLSQLLTVTFGGTVMRYSITIGIFLFSLGIGAFIYEQITKHGHLSTSRNAKLFFHIEITLAFMGFVSVFFILLENLVIGTVSEIASIIIAYIPIVIIGVVSGIEIPLLTQMSGGRFARILGIDYFGSLFGTIVYALFLYPKFGLVATMIAMSIINAVISIVVLFIYSLYTIHMRYIASIVISGLIIGMIQISNRLDAFVEDTYLSHSILTEYKRYNIPVTNVDILHRFTTPYQHVSLYRTHFEYPKYNPDDFCLNLDEHVQMCNSWYRAYHNGLVDVPMAIIPNNKQLNILLIGGGDFIPVEFLRQYDNRISHIDMVDIDAKFQEYAKTSTFLLEKNNSAFEYSKLTIHVDDALHYLKKAVSNDAKQKYDLILIDLPGLKHDKLLPLYSVEFYKMARFILNEDGTLISWQYQSKYFPRHVEALESTLYTAGWNRKLDYMSYNIFDDGTIQETELFFAVQNGNTPINLNINDSLYIKRFKNSYNKLTWKSIANKTKPNGIFNPNYDMIISKKMNP